MSSFEKHRAALMSRLSELDGRLHKIEAELDAEHSKDWEEAAVEHESDEVLEQLGKSGQQEIARIRAALQRMRDGTYGQCVRCSAQISGERLATLPETPLCKECVATM
jgi:RNA polymerase-binding transcription factor DksA